MSDGGKGVYHETQELYRCGVHALNNVLQAKVFEKSTLDDACLRLAALADPSSGGGSGGGSLWSRVWNPHRAPLGLGNYDVNALMFVLEEKGYQMQWVDKRRPVNRELLDCDAIEGVLCNVVTSNFLRSVWESRHWFAIKKIGGVYYNLDSKLAKPVAFASEDECFRFLQELVDTGECELFSIAKADAEPDTTAAQ
ncbi:hypothetical protein Gpo141_00006837 [Globisporangium polare]